MAVILPSRFAVLKVEGDEPDETKTAKKPAKTGSNSDKNSQAAKPKPKKKKKPAEKDGQARAQAAGSNIKPTDKSGDKPQDWESWKKRDDQFVSEAYEQDLQQALLLSRLDYEEKKEFYEAHEKEAVQVGPASSCDAKKPKKKKNLIKKDKKTTMSLDEFNHLGEAASSCEVLEAKEHPDSFGASSEKRPPVLSKEDIFDEVAKDAKTILTREQRREDLKNKQPFLVEQVRSLQFQDQLDKKDEVIAGLRADVERLTAQLHVVKLRNKQLCTILGQGEMQDKAEILRDFEEVTQVKDELTQQVTELHAALEQERSKVRSLQLELKKSGKKEGR
ncbi:unnamed protein product [Ixodes persulcatus]